MAFLLQTKPDIYGLKVDKALYFVIPLIRYRGKNSCYLLRWMSLVNFQPPLSISGYTQEKLTEEAKQLLAISLFEP